MDLKEQIENLRNKIDAEYSVIAQSRDRLRKLDLELNEHLDKVESVIENICRASSELDEAIETISEKV